MRKFVLTGPECSGKTTLSKSLAEHFEGNTWLNRQDYSEWGKVTPKDLLVIFQAYVKREDGDFSDNVLFLDTDLQNLFLWWQEKYGPAPRKLCRAYKAQSERFFLLCRPDLPWVYDPLRENPIDRGRIFELYYRDMVDRKLPFAVIEGDGPVRLEMSIEIATVNV